MKWSFSSARAFRSCQRGWYFKTCVASAVANDPARREAYLLSKLQSISGWRGSLVDRIISSNLIPSINRHRPLTKSQLLDIAKKQFDQELAFALQHRIRTPGMKFSDEIHFAAFRACEYGPGIAKEELDRAWNDVEAAIGNLFAMEQIRTELKAASYVLAQRSLQFPFAGASVAAVPDVIAFRAADPPLIIDWKVHTFGSNDYRLQLALYALALTQCKPHKDFPESLHLAAPKDVRLLEVQLLTTSVHEYVLDDADFDELEDYVGATASEMLAAIDAGKKSDLLPEDFAPARRADQCERCVFAKICWGMTNDTA